MNSLILLVALQMAALGQSGTQYGGVLEIYQAQVTHAVRNIEHESGFYVAEFVYDATFCWMPLTYPLGQPHYSANITLWKVVDSRKQRYAEFKGTYTPDGCFEDAPDELMKQANTMRNKMLEIFSSSMEFIP